MTCKNAEMAEDDQNSFRTYDMHPVQLTVDALLQQCNIRRSRHSGPGGQHRNKVETAIEITHRPTGIISFAAERRSQEQNRQVAMSRLRLLLAIRVRSVGDTRAVVDRVREGACRARDG